MTQQGSNPKALGKPKGLLQWLSSFVHTVLVLSALRGEMPKSKLRGPVPISELRHLREKTSPGFNKHLMRVERRMVAKDGPEVYP
ncbi:hypothetical protein N7447_010587 [Penicillium robsamsonii]|uniref:uncharacterized protein n=1 Tax=Penicillium robsamsonii TaxID=1792511 RepID=UPI002547A693|nr:uncharacterized protein N7447_010587 [Penicillium robsamsonii]KAJ5811071.1 hypothetical protein N7447_010587 [Penicillium robsamsonii]